MKANYLNNCTEHLLLAIIASLVLLSACSADTQDISPQSGAAGNIPLIWVEPSITETSDAFPRHLIIWQDGFTGNKENTLPYLEELAENGFVALSFDNFQHGRRALPNDHLWNRVFAKDHFRKGMWPILGQSVEDATTVIDWAIKELEIDGKICMGGFSMGGDIAVATAGVDNRINCVAAIVSTPNWQRPNMHSFGDNPSLVAQGTADTSAQDFFDLYNPSTNIAHYSHQPAITFESGKTDQHIPASDALMFQSELLSQFPEMNVRVIEHNSGHSLSKSMWQNAKNWFILHLKN